MNKSFELFEDVTNPSKNIDAMLISHRNFF